MKIDDYEDVIKLWKNTKGVGLNESDSKENLAIYLQRNPNLSFVAHDSNKLVGTVICGHDGRNGFLGHLAVSKDYQKQGIGKAFVNACLKALEKHNIPKCKIFVFTQNKEAKEFWKHMGWVQRDDLTVMHRKLR